MTTKKKTTKPKPKPKPKYALFDEIIYTEYELEDQEDFEDLEIEKGVIHSIKYRNYNKTFIYGIQKPNTRNTRTNGYGNFSSFVICDDNSLEDIEESLILGKTTNSLTAINKLYDKRIQEIEKQRTQTLKKFKNE